ncbi:MAG: MBL fold metallo-hydrolase [Phyllobacterium sp.]
MIEIKHSETAEFSLKIWGARGSIPVSGKEYWAFGGNTISIQIRCGKTDLLFDAGTGIRNATRALLAEGATHFNLFFSHSHYDHIMGLPFFEPLFDPSFTADIWAGHLHGRMTARQMIEDFIRPPWVDGKPTICEKRIKFHDFVPGQTLQPTKRLSIVTRGLKHPGGCVGYRVEFGGRSVALVYDVEHEPGMLDPVALELMRKADLVVYDSAYLDEEMETYRGFGHSSWQQGIRLANASCAKSIIFFHHMPTRTDADLLAIEYQARGLFPRSFTAREGMKMEL